MARKTSLTEKQARIEIVNKIIAEISSRGRRFFYHDGNVATLLIRNNRIWYKSELNGKHGIYEICLSVRDYRKPKKWHHGGTLLGLVRDFCDFIRTAEYSNHNHGYGGLYCPHWGYPAEDMRAIQELALSLGYLKQGVKP